MQYEGVIMERLIEKKADPEFKDWLKKTIGDINIEIIEVEYVKNSTRINPKLSSIVKQKLNL